MTGHKDVGDVQVSAERDPEGQADVARVLASVGDLPMPADVWERLRAVLRGESCERDATLDCRPAPVMPGLDKDVLPETRPSATRY